MQSKRMREEAAKQARYISADEIGLDVPVSEIQMPLSMLGSISSATGHLMGTANLRSSASSPSFSSASTPVSAHHHPEVEPEMLQLNRPDEMISSALMAASPGRRVQDVQQLRAQPRMLNMQHGGPVVARNMALSSRTSSNSSLHSIGQQSSLLRVPPPRGMPGMPGMSGLSNVMLPGHMHNARSLMAQSQETRVYASRSNIIDDVGGQLFIAASMPPSTMASGASTPIHTAQGDIAMSRSSSRESPSEQVRRAQSWRAHSSASSGCPSPALGPMRSVPASPHSKRSTPQSGKTAELLSAAQAAIADNTTSYYKLIIASLFEPSSEHGGRQKLNNAKLGRVVDDDVLNVVLPYHEALKQHLVADACMPALPMHRGVRLTEDDVRLVHPDGGAHKPMPWMLMILLTSESRHELANEIFQIIDIVPSLDICISSTATTENETYSVNQPLFISIMNLIMSKNMDVSRRPCKERILSWLDKIEKPQFLRRVTLRPDSRSNSAEERIEAGKKFDGENVISKLCDYRDQNDEPLTADDWLSIQGRYSSKYHNCVGAKRQDTLILNFTNKFIDMYVKHRPSDELPSETTKWYGMINFLLDKNSNKNVNMLSFKYVDGDGAPLADGAQEPLRLTMIDLLRFHTKDPILEIDIGFFLQICASVCERHRAEAAAGRTAQHGTYEPLILERLLQGVALLLSKISEQNYDGEHAPQPDSVQQLVVQSEELWQLITTKITTSQHSIEYCTWLARGFLISEWKKKGSQAATPVPLEESPSPASASSSTSPSGHDDLELHAQQMQHINIKSMCTAGLCGFADHLRQVSTWLYRNSSLFLDFHISSWNEHQKDCSNMMINGLERPLFIDVLESIIDLCREETRLFKLTARNQQLLGEAIRTMCEDMTCSIESIVSNFEICASALAECFATGSQVFDTIINSLVDGFCNLLRRTFPYDKMGGVCPVSHEMIQRFLTLLNTAKDKAILQPHQMKKTISGIIIIIDVISAQCSSQSNTFQVRGSIINALLRLPNNVAYLSEYFADGPAYIYEDTNLVSTTLQLAYQKIVQDVLIRGFTLHGYFQTGGAYKRSTHQADEHSILRLLRLGSASCLAVNEYKILDLSRLGFPELVKCLPASVAARTGQSLRAVSDNLQAFGDVRTVLERIIHETSALDIDEQTARALAIFSPAIMLPIFAAHLHDLLSLESLPREHREFNNVGTLYALYRIGVTIGDAIARNKPDSDFNVSELVEALKAISILLNSLFAKVPRPEVGKESPSAGSRGSSSSSVIQPSIKISSTINAIIDTYGGLLDDEQQELLRSHNCRFIRSPLRIDRMLTINNINAAAPLLPAGGRF
jgi:hypothetical protein